MPNARQATMIDAPPYGRLNSAGITPQAPSKSRSKAADLPQSYLTRRLISSAGALAMEITPSTRPYQGRRLLICLTRRLISSAGALAMEITLSTLPYQGCGLPICLARRLISSAGSCWCPCAGLRFPEFLLSLSWPDRVGLRTCTEWCRRAVDCVLCRCIP